jgi:N-acetylmuramoyl-L-alanine amidase
MSDSPSTSSARPPSATGAPAATGTPTNSAATAEAPVGSGEHVVRQGECISSIAKEHGHFWETIWNDGGNSELREKRKDPSVLLPGDRLVIPEKRRKEESGNTEKRHKFRRKGEPAKVRIQVLRNDEPRKNEPYIFTVDGKTESGNTDGEGMVEMNIPPNAVRGELSVGKGDDVEVFHFQLGTVDPIETESGARGRLRCLGYDAAQPFDQLIKDFQGKEDLEATGRLDEQTKNRLKERFGE